MMLTPAASIWLLVENLIYILHPLLKLLSGLLTSHPGYIPDPHPPGAPQGAGLGLHLLKSLWAELEESVLEGLKHGAVIAWQRNAGGGWATIRCCMNIRLAKEAWSRILTLVLYWLSVSLCGIFMDLSLVEVIRAFTGQRCSLCAKGIVLNIKLFLKCKLCPEPHLPHF